MDLDYLMSAGIDAADAIERRFPGMEALYKKMIFRFPDDENFEKLKKAIAEDDRKAALSASHALKGTCGNLSMFILFRLFTEQVSLIRHDKWNEACDMMPEITANYEKVINALKQQSTN